MKQLLRLLREPLFHFMAIGGLIFTVYAAVDDSGEAPADVIVITPGRIDQLAAGYNSVWQRMPTDTELDALIQAEIREEVYYREALALDLDKNDAIVRRRMGQKMQFLLDTGAFLQEPATGELEAYFVANERTYRSGGRQRRGKSANRITPSGANALWSRYAEAIRGRHRTADVLRGQANRRTDSRATSKWCEPISRSASSTS